MINTIQMIMLTALFVIALPSNAQTLMFSLLRMSNLDIMKTEELHRNLFGATEQEPFNAIFDTAGYETTNFFIESGTLVFVFVTFILFTALKALLRFATRKCGKNCLTKRLRKREHLNVSIVRFLLEGCLDLGLVSTIALLKWHGNFSFAEFTAIVLLVVLFITPFYILWAACKFRKSTADDFDEDEAEEVKLKYAKLFTNLWSK